ncbi:MAG TPA: nucleotidyl transferase AbiEii/AbiGii toxin family protein [Puia sp.]|jgi:predicted nucleotidyltransferase component of viral defense system
MIEWLNLPSDIKRQTLEEAATRTGLRPTAIEKDWWVTLTLKACFHTEYRSNLVFKGGTSLSKAWGLIERFSEDIDLVMNREVLGFAGELSNNQIKRLREKTAEFVAITFRDALDTTLQTLGVSPEWYKLGIQPGGVADRDPQVLELYYPSVIESDGYLKDKVVIEIGARSLLEPAEVRGVQSIIGQTFKDSPFADPPFPILTVNPKRTFLEKVFLLHEEFIKVPEKRKHERMSRHLYDVEKLMDTEFGMEALQDGELYALIVSHRAKYTTIRGLDYAAHGTQTLDFVPPEDLRSVWERDYRQMQRSMIYGSSLPFPALIERLTVLRKRFRSVNK